MIEDGATKRWRGGRRRAAVVRVRLSPPYLSRPPPDAHATPALRPRPCRARAMSPFRQHTSVPGYNYGYCFSSVGHSPEISQ